MVQHSYHHDDHSFSSSSSSSTSVAAAILTHWAPLCRQWAPLSSVAFYAAPLATVRRLRRERTVGAVPLLPYTTMVLSNGLWVAYGILRREPSILVANGTGLLLGGAYFVCYLQLYFLGQQQRQSSSSSSSSSPSKQQQQPQQQSNASSSLLPGTVAQHVQSIAGMAVLIVLLVVCGESSDAQNQRQEQERPPSSSSSLQLPFHFPSYNAANALGTAGVVLSIAMFASPLVALRTVIRTANAQSISTATVAATVASNALWGVAGGYSDMNDRHVAAQGAIGLAVGAVQLMVKLWYGNGPPGRAGLKQRSLLKRNHSSDEQDVWVKSSEHNSGIGDESDSNDAGVGVSSPVVELVPPSHHADDLHTTSKARIKVANKRHPQPAVKEIQYV